MEKWEGAQLNQAKVILADQATQLLHGQDCLEAIHETAKSLFSSGGKSYDSLPKIVLGSDMVGKLESGSGLTVVEIMILADMATSKTEARKAILNGGARVNDEKVVSDSAVVNKVDFNSDGQMKLSLGKKKHALIVMS